jgi:hypothetical protein
MLQVAAMAVNSRSGLGLKFQKLVLVKVTG